MAALTSRRLAKHYEGQHDQKDHGRWAGKTRGEIQEMLAGYPSMDLSELSTLTMLDEWTSRDYIDERMSDEFEEEVERHRQEWMEANDPDDEGVFGPDPKEMQNLAYSSLSDEAESKMDELRDEIQALLREEVEGVYSVSGTSPNGEEWYSEVEDVYSDYDGIKVTGSFYVDGSYAGNFERVLTEDNAYRALLVIEDEYAGLGIAGAFNHQEEMAYLRSGLDSVTITAADLSHGDFRKPPGSYVWASQGYDFNGPPHSVISALQRYIQSNAEYNSLHPRIRATIDDVANRFQNLPISDPNYPTPREVSQLGRLPNEEWWAGKAIMAHGGVSIDEARSNRHAGPMWAAIKRLDDPEGIRVSLGEIRSQQVRAEVASAVDQHVSAWRASNPQLDFGSEFITVNGQPVPIAPTDSMILQVLGL
jgi:hypothetical protein